jgi:HAE1 family hydrophobic/amphiphilic exporter-1
LTSLPRFSVNNPVLVNLAMMAVLIGGVFSYLTLIREMFPESRPDRILIVTPYPGATPAEVEKGITRKIEEQIKDVEGIEKIESSISEGSSRIYVELRSDFDDMDQALRDIENAVDAIPRDDFPEEALETQVFKFDPTWPVIMVSLYGDVDRRTLKVLGEQLRDDILRLPSITDVVLSGTRRDEIGIEVRPEKLVEYGVSFMDVGQAIAASNMDLPGGQVKGAEANVAVRTLGEKDWGEELYGIIVRSDPDGRVVRLRDVASIVDGFEDVEVSSQFQGKSSVSVTAYKTPEQDAIEIASLVKAMVVGKKGEPLERSTVDRVLASLTGDDPVRKTYEAALDSPLPAGVEMEYHSDLSRFIEGRLNLLKRNGSYGLLLVFASLLLLLHWRVAFWVMMGLTLAICGSLVCMAALGQSLNLITMFGLIIVLGLLVDDAIIVAENVYAKIEQGQEPGLAAVTGTEEVTWPVVCAILTTIVAFLPLVNVEGRMGNWFGVLPIIVCLALTVSLFEALSILPCHLAHGLRPASRTDRDTEKRRLGVLGALSHRVRLAQDYFVRRKLLVGYEQLIRLATRYRYVTMACLLAGLMTALGLVHGQHVPFVFIQKMDSETLMAMLELPVGTPSERTAAAAHVIEEAALDLDELRIVSTLIGAQLDDDLLAPSERSHVAQVFIELKEITERERNSEQILAELRARTTDIPGVERLRYDAIHGGPGGTPIQLEISGDRIEDLLAVAAFFKKRLREFAGVSDIADDFNAGRREVQIELYDSARGLGLTTRSLATQVRSAFYGFEARKLQRGREDVKIMVRYPPESRRQIYDIESMYVAAPSGAMIPFTEVARLKEGTGYSAIERKDQRRTVTIKADVDEAETNAEKVIAVLSKDFPKVQRQYPGLTLEFGGSKLETNKSLGSLKKGFVFAVLMIYAILAGLFRSYLQPLIIMAAIPFGLIGAVAGHFVMGYPLTILSMIGLVALTGIVANDALILVSFINRRIAAGTPPYEAVIQASKGRLRPILLTSATTVLGLAPLLMETSFQAKFLIPMGISISAGLIFATVLTLIAVPALYLILLDVKGIFGRGFAWLLGRPKDTDTVCGNVSIGHPTPE